MGRNVSLNTATTTSRRPTGHNLRSNAHRSVAVTTAPSVGRAAASRDPQPAATASPATAR